MNNIQFLNPMSINLRYFFPLTTPNETINAQLTSLESLSYASNTAVLFGPSQRYGYNQALLGRHVIYISDRESLQRATPLTGEGETFDERILEKITMVYITTDVQLRRYFASLQLLETLPEVIILDQYEHYFSPNVDRSVHFKTLAFLMDGIEYLSHASEMSGDDRMATRATLIIGSENNMQERKRIFLEWVKMGMVLLSPRERQFRLIVDTIHKKKPSKNIEITYTLGDEAITVDNIHIQDRM